MKNAEVAALLKSISESLDKLSAIFASTPELTYPEPENKSEASIPEEVATADTSAPEASVKTYSKEDVRAALAQMAKADDGKYKDEVRKLVAKYSSDGSLSKVPEDKYTELMAALEVMRNA